MRFIAAAFFIIVPLTAVADPTLGVPNTSNHPPSGSPVVIDECTAGQSGNLLLSESDGRFKIAFTNEGSTTADLVRFRLNLGNESLSIRDVGSFAPGVTITHTYRRRGGNVVASPLFAPSSLTCSVEAVHFADGSDWTPSNATSSTSVSAPSPVATVDADSSHTAKGWLGIRLSQEGPRVLVSLVLPNSAGFVAGIKQGDAIDEIEGNKITSVDDAKELISTADPGETLHVTVQRKGKVLHLIAIVGLNPAHS